MSGSSAKLLFHHGVVSSAKTLNLLAIAHTYKTQGKSVLVMKPAIDSRFGEEEVKSRASLMQKADVLISPETDLLRIPVLLEKKIHCILVDEAQFLRPDQIDQLRMLTDSFQIPVHCYGLRTDFTTHLFPASRRLLELADSIVEVETTCYYCASKAMLNLKHVNGVADTTGPIVQLGAEEKYFPTCFSCYRKNTVEANQSPVQAWNNHVPNHM